jgi:hypothetical protein
VILEMVVGIIIIFQVKFRLDNTEALRQSLGSIMGPRLIYGHLHV